MTSTINNVTFAMEAQSMPCTAITVLIYHHWALLRP